MNLFEKSRSSVLKIWSTTGRHRARTNTRSWRLISQKLEISQVSCGLRSYSKLKSVIVLCVAFVIRHAAIFSEYFVGIPDRAARTRHWQKSRDFRPLVTVETMSGHDCALRTLSYFAFRDHSESRSSICCPRPDLPFARRAMDSFSRDIAIATGHLLCYI